MMFWIGLASGFVLFGIIDVILVWRENKDNRIRWGKLNKKVPDA